jgi:hypothetical protein
MRPQITSVYIHEFGNDGVRRPRLATALYHTRFFVDSFLHRDIRLVSNLPPTTPCSVPTWSSHLDYHTSRGSMGWVICHSDWQWSWCVFGRCDTGRYFYASQYGRLQLVVDRIAKIQERDPWPMGSSEAHYPTALGLTLVRGSE